jgi:hypothetical protein
MIGGEENGMGENIAVHASINGVENSSELEQQRKKIILWEGNNGR